VHQRVGSREVGGVVFVSSGAADRISLCPVLCVGFIAYFEAPSIKTPYERLVVQRLKVFNAFGLQACFNAATLPKPGVARI
jgi:hypothetical protein